MPPSGVAMITGGVGNAIAGARSTTRVAGRGWDTVADEGRANNQAPALAVSTQPNKRSISTAPTIHKIVEELLSRR